jgi:hypothetical protein
MSDEQFYTEMTELSALAEAHIEAMRVDQEQWEAEMYGLCDLADRIDAVARDAGHEKLRKLLTLPVPSRPTSSWEGGRGINGAN